jgi:Holliday junction DNA helicase RuvA
MFDLVVSLYHKSTKSSSGARDILLAMIGYLVGTVHTVTEKDLLLLTGGVGYRILAPLPILLAQKEGEPVSLYIHTHVREDAITLYGFATDVELELFERLISVSGIGPKSALAMLSVHSPASVAEAVERSDAALLSHTPGIGKKTAEKIIIELKGKLTHLQSAEVNDNILEVRLALEALGYSPKEVHEVISKLDPLEKNTSTLIKQALSLLR